MQRKCQVFESVPAECREFRIDFPIREASISASCNDANPGDILRPIAAPVALE